MQVQKYKVKLGSISNDENKIIGSPVYKENGSDIIIGFVSEWNGTDATITLFESMDLPVENKNITVSSRSLSDEEMFKDFNAANPKGSFLRDLVENGEQKMQYETEYQGFFI